MKERSKKMILVSIIFRGKTHWVFANATKRGKRYVVDPAVVERLLKEAGCYYRGQTYTLG